MKILVLSSCFFSQFHICRVIEKHDKWFFVFERNQLSNHIKLLPKLFLNQLNVCCAISRIGKFARFCLPLNHFLKWNLFGSMQPFWFTHFFIFNKAMHVFHTSLLHNFSFENFVDQIWLTNSFFIKHNDSSRNKFEDSIQVLSYILIENLNFKFASSTLMHMIEHKETCTKWVEKCLGKL